MPEYPDVELYRSAIGARIVGARLAGFRIASPHLLASVETPPDALIGRLATGVRRIGKQLVMEFEEDLFCAVHLAVAGRFHWTGATGGAKPVRLSPRGNLAVWSYEAGPAGGGHLRLVERSPKKRASIRVGQGAEQLRALDRGGLEIPGSNREEFAARLAGLTNTIKRALTEPARFAGVGNAYSDEILHRARLSPSKRAGTLSPEEVGRLHAAAEAVLTEWAVRLQAESGSAFPTGVTAFREGMAVHGRYGRPCPECGSPVQRVRRAENEFNYCATCQTGGRLLADRAMSRLLRKKWPRTLRAAERATAAAGFERPRGELAGLASAALRATRCQTESEEPEQPPSSDRSRTMSCEKEKRQPAAAVRAAGPVSQPTRLTKRASMRDCDADWFYDGRVRRLLDNRLVIRPAGQSGVNTQPSQRGLTAPHTARPWATALT